ncbi:MAG: acetate/propionate family kinase [Verrucomicrobiaceae bacterium]|nr:acetate/propionate family kinase [Verrucomicrobiaceae bacterium]
MVPLTDRILCLNPGSSAFRYAVYESDGETEIDRRHVDGLDAGDLESHRHALESVLDSMDSLSLAGIGYRVVHGGDLYSARTIIDDTVVEGLRSLAHLAPQHLPIAIGTIEIVRQRSPNLHHVARFDTAFHHGLPDVAKRFPLPESLWSQGIRRYGFHGLSFEYVVRSLGERLPKRTVIAHLGNGSSMVALLDGVSVDTTMGMTPAGGLMMGSRSGDLDPGVVVHLLREMQLSPDALDDLVNKEAGLKGVSGLTSDMRTLLTKRGESPSADLAIRMYCYHVRKHIGAMSAVLGGLDLLVFTGGVGENAKEVRDEILRGLEYLHCDTEVVRTNESQMMARHVRDAITHTA